MSIKSLFLYLLLGLLIYLSSCSKSENIIPDPDPNPNPIDTTQVDTTKNDTIPKDTTTSSTNLTYPTSFIFKSNNIPETEYFQITTSGKLKVNEPYYMRYSKNLLISSIKDDHAMPYKEIRFVSKDKLTIVYKDSSIIENIVYSLKNNIDLYLQTSGYLGSFNSDKTIFNINLSPYTYSNDANRPMYPRLYLCVSKSPDKDQTISYLTASQSLVSGDTLAVNFAQMVYHKK